MADEHTDTPETDEGGPKALREALERAKAEAAEARKEANAYKVRALEAAFREAGLDPAKGVGKAVAKEYDGEVTPEAIRAYAESEYGWEAPSQESAIAPVVREAQARVSSVQAESVSQPTSMIDQQIRDAEQSGDFAAAVALKTQKLMQSSTRSL